MYSLMVKSIQISIDEQLLKEIDRQAETRARGRSAFIRRAVAEALRRRRDSEIDAAYRRGYGTDPQAVEEIGPWLGEQSWPEK